MLACARRCASSRSLPLFPPEIWTYASCTKVGFHRGYKTSSYRHLSTGTTRHNAPYNILFAGSDTFSCIILEALAREGRACYDQLHVLVGPDKRVSRGHKATYRPMLRSLAEELKLPIHVLPTLGIKDWTPPVPFSDRRSSNLLITASFGYFVPPAILDQFGHLNALNLHPSLLPLYKGAAPIQWTISNGDVDTGVTLQTLSPERFDDGLILAQERMRIPDPDSMAYSDLEGELAAIGARLLVNSLRHLPQLQEGAKPQGQIGIKPARAPKIKTEHSRIDWWVYTAKHIHARHRAFGHQHPLWTVYNGKRVQLLDIDLVEGASAAPGLARLNEEREVLLIGCQGGATLRVRQLKTEGRKALPALQWWIGAARNNDSLQLG